MHQRPRTLTPQVLVEATTPQKALRIACKAVNRAAQQAASEGLLLQPAGQLPSQLAAVAPDPPAPAEPAAQLPAWHTTPMSFKRLMHLNALQLLAPDVRLFILDEPQLLSLQCRMLLLALKAGHPAAVSDWRQLTGEQQAAVEGSAALLPRLALSHQLSLRRDVPRPTEEQIAAALERNPDLFCRQELHAAVLGRLLAAACMENGAAEVLQVRS